MNTFAKIYYPEGVKRFKLTWVDPLNPTNLYSHMFDSLAESTTYANTLNPKFDYMMFEFGGINSGVYKWELLPFGAYKSYKYGMIISEFIGVFIILLMIILYITIKK